MYFTKMTTAILAVTVTALLTGCSQEQSEKDMLAEAEFCLDDATNSSAANACMTKIEGLTSESRVCFLRCAAGFISAGVTSPQNLSQVLNSMSEGGSTASVLGLIAFDSQNLADTTFTYCTASKSEGMMLLGALAKSATVIASLTSGSGDIETQMQTAITDILDDLQNGNPSEQAEALENIVKIGGTIQTVYQTTCGTAIANEDICNSISDAAATLPGGIDVTTATPEELGQALLDYWKDLNH